MSSLLFISGGTTAEALTGIPRCEALTMAVQTASPGSHSPAALLQYGNSPGKTCSHPDHPGSILVPQLLTVPLKDLFCPVKEDVLPVPATVCRWWQNSSLKTTALSWSAKRPLALRRDRQRGCRGQPSLHASISTLLKELSHVWANADPALYLCKW